MKDLIYITKYLGILKMYDEYWLVLVPLVDNYGFFFRKEFFNRPDYQIFKKSLSTNIIERYKYWDRNR